MKWLIQGGILLSAALLGGLIRSAQWKQRRRHRGIPDGVSVLYEDSGHLYLASAMPAVVVLMVLGLLLFVSGDMDAAAWDAARPYLLLIFGMAGLLQLLCLALLAARNRQRILWNEEGIWVDPLFGPRRAVRYAEIHRLDRCTQPGWTRTPGVIAYDLDGERLFSATETMPGYGLFLNDLYRQCPRFLGEREEKHQWNC
ncbi:MAG: hypothetical protein KH009_09600 [Clostridiales bacterium]|nr:hypothetical protein [Clostridiales bacterium]